MRRIYIIFGAVLLIFPPLPRFFLFGESLFLSFLRAVDLELDLYQKAFALSRPRTRFPSNFRKRASEPNPRIRNFSERRKTRQAFAGGKRYARRQAKDARSSGRLSYTELLYGVMSCYRAFIPRPFRRSAFRRGSRRSPFARGRSPGSSRRRRNNRPCRAFCAKAKFPRPPPQRARRQLSLLSLLRS